MEATCPDITVWQEYCDGSITPEGRLAAESHLASCLRCRHQLISLFDAAREAHVELAPDFSKARALRLAPEKAKKTFFTTFRPFVPVAFAAAIILAVGVSFLIYRDKTGITPTGDLRQSNDASSQIALTNPPDNASLESGKVEFRWSDPTAAARYEFTLTDEKGDIVFQEQNATSPLLLDTATLKLLPQRRYYWSVTAKLPDGTRRESSVVSFTMK